MSYAPTAIKGPNDERSMKNGGAAALTAKRIVKITADKTVDVATAYTDALFGVLTQSSGVYAGTQDPGANAVGVYENVQRSGKAVVTAGGVVSAGNPITSDSVGRGISAAALVAAGTAVSIIGFAATAASGAGVDFEVELNPACMYNSQPALSVATHAALRAISAATRYDGMLAQTQNDNANWRFVAAGTATDTSENLIVTPTAGTGVWVRTDAVIEMALAFTYQTADAAALLTVPAGCELHLLDLAWYISTTMAGGSSSAIGASSSKTGYSTKGDLLGGATGDVAATLVSTGAKYKAGTIGAGFDTLARRDGAYLVAADTIRFDRITSVFTSGVGSVMVRAQVIANAGA